ncbi:MAG TPA: dihydrofolate reductase family protein [Ignavibacteriaceae bacterium]|nr:dihydrofolate reductase family protein [Ignavibacteriaceae bacterium]
MRKIIFSTNSTINGGADHTSGIADDELHNFYTDYLDNIDVVLMGRKTYELMEGYWPVAHEDPQNTKSTLRFADKFNSVRKIIFTNKLKKVDWQNSVIAEENLIEIVKRLKNEDGKNISAGSLSIASQLLNKNMIDEFWFLIHPIISNKGKRLFEEFDGMRNLKLMETRIFNSGVIVMHYQKNEN